MTSTSRIGCRASVLEAPRSGDRTATACTSGVSWRSRWLPSRTRTWPAEHVENALEEIEPDGKDRQGDKRRDAVAGQDPIINLQHVERAGQRQHVDHARHRRDGDKGTSESGQCLCQMVLRPRALTRRT